MSDITSSSVLSAANGQESLSVLSLKMQSQAEQQMAGVVAQAVQPQPASSQQQPALQTSGPRGTQVNLLV